MDGKELIPSIALYISFNLAPVWLLLHTDNEVLNMTDRELLEILVKTVTGIDQRLDSVEKAIARLGTEIQALKVAIASTAVEQGAEEYDVVSTVDVDNLAIKSHDSGAEGDD